MENNLCQFIIAVRPFSPVHECVCIYGFPEHPPMSKLHVCGNRIYARTKPRLCIVTPLSSLETFCSASFDVRFARSSDAQSSRYRYVFNLSTLPILVIDQFGTSNILGELSQHRPYMANFALRIDTLLTCTVARCTTRAQSITSPLRIMGQNQELDVHFPVFRWGFWQRKLRQNPKSGFRKKILCIRGYTITPLRKPDSYAHTLRRTIQEKVNRAGHF